MTNCPLSHNLLKLMVADNYDEWYELLMESKEARKFVFTHNTKLEELNVSMICQIRLGLQHKLQESQILDYLNPQFSYEQMKKIREAYEKELSKEEVAVFLCSNFDHWQMNELIDGFLNGLSIEQVKTYANPDYTSGQMYTKRLALETNNKIANLSQIMNLHDNKF